MTKGQKEAVVELVLNTLGTKFISNSASALSMLSNNQLNAIKKQITDAIMNGTVAYSKPLVFNEVKAYASSMVMNHLKKAKELNPTAAGGNSTNSKTVKNKTEFTISGEEIAIMPDYALEILKANNEKAVF